MSEYLKLAVSTTLYLYDQDAITGLPVTGKVAADYTVQITKDGTGNQATTGVVGPTEVSAGNNAGVYSLAVSGSTAFLSATGVYEFKVFRTADLTLVWNETFIVTSDGTGAGTYGIASFTATASNGRIMSGGLALAGATVTITNSSGVIYTQLTSDASGLWGPVYFNTNGTYTIYVQKVGYTTTSGTIVVVGATATGPGADLTITAVSSGSTLLVSTLQSYLSRVMLDASGSKFNTLSLEIINEAAEMVFMEMQWPFWNRAGVIELLAPYTTGTLTLTAGSATVAFAGSTLPAWVDAGCDIFIPSTGNWYRISTRDSSTQVTITDAYNGTTTASLAFNLARIRMELPDTCARTNDLLFGANWPYRPVMVSAAKLEAMKDAWQTSDSITCMWAIEQNYICVWPPPQEYKRVNFMYFHKPVQVTSGSDTLDFPPEQVFLLRRAMDYCAALRSSTSGENKQAVKKAYDDGKAIALAWDKTTANISPEGVDGPYPNGMGLSQLGWMGPVTTL
jgi:hypothetical protein